MTDVANESLHIPRPADEVLMSDIPADAMRETWDGVYDLSLQLVDTIETHSRTTGEQFDRMVVIPRGSYPVANVLARELGFKSRHMLHACLDSYKIGTTDRADDFKFGQMPAPSDVQGLNLLVVEEVCQTARTLHYLTSYFRDCGAELVRVGVLHDKPSKHEVDFEPDWAVKTTDKWVVYPWEINDRRGLTSGVRRLQPDELDIAETVGLKD